MNIPVNAKVLRHALASEVIVARMVQGKHVGADNNVIDVIAGRHGIEVKTIIRGGIDKITVHPRSRRRKERWSAKTGKALHTVVIDDRKARRMYYRSGVGAFRLHTMTPVRSASHLRSLLSA